jgi:hypothetical protein
VILLNMTGLKRQLKLLNTVIELMIDTTLVRVDKILVEGIKVPTAGISF